MSSSPRERLSGYAAPPVALSVPTDKGANAGLKVSALVAGMVAGADSINDMALLRHGGMSRGFDRAYAPSTLGSFLRAFTSVTFASSTRSPRGF